MYENRTVAVLRESLTGCFLETAYLREGVTDLTTPVSFRLDLRLEQEEPSDHTLKRGGRDSRGAAMPNINQFPILEKAGATRVLEVPFQKWCGEDDVCNSHVSCTQEEIYSQTLSRWRAA